MQTSGVTLRRLVVAMSVMSMTALASVGMAADGNARQIAQGPFQPTWESLQQQYQCPDWFRDAKFGIWAHWGPQCQPEQGDWYAQHMYQQGNAQNKYHVQTYGPPSQFGFKDICNVWKAEKFDPEKLISLYKRAGARYFVQMANHHCNFDNWDSAYQPWNSVNIGPKKDIVGLWADAARKAGLRFGVTVHAARAWTWYEAAQGADKEGSMAGVPYDGKLTKADGKGKWWEGYDPQDLYAQNHPLGAKPDQAYCDKFFLRVKDLVDKYKPDLLYFDDGVLPLRGVSEDYGLRIAAHYYNSSIRWNGKNEAVMNTKGLNESQRKALVWDIERGKTDQLASYPWQTDTCIGNWHYKRSIFEKHGYKTTTQVVTMLVDIVSKNGNLLLNIPVRGDGTIDEDEVKVLEGMAQWMAVNGEAIYGTRPWTVYGEGATTGTGKGTERDTRAYSASDIRFTTKPAPSGVDGPGTVYAFCLALPTTDVRIVSLGRNSKVSTRAVSSVQLLGSKEKLSWTQEPDALVIRRPAKMPCEHAIAFKIAFGGTVAGTAKTSEEVTAEVLSPAREPDVIFVPTPQAVVDKMLEMAEIKPGDVVYDLGCGNGIIVVTAAKKYGVKAVGFDINPERIKESLENVRANHVENLVTIKQADIFTMDLSEASVVTLYLLPSLNVKLMPQLEKLRPGSRIVSHDFDMRGAKPVQTATVSSENGEYFGTEHTVYKWVVPWEKETSASTE